MAVIRLPEMVYAEVERHLFSEPDEHFGFLVADWAESAAGPVFLVRGFHPVADDQVKISDAYELTTGAILSAINVAVREDKALIEVHNHPGGPPGFSRTDRAGFEAFVPYVLDSLPGRPYAATVWTREGVHGEYFVNSETPGEIRSITVLGDRLIPVPSEASACRWEQRFDRQEPWFTRSGQEALGRLRLGIVGLGGTGSQVVQNLVYLGIRDFVLIDEDTTDETNMNRLVTADAADVGTPKAILARRLIRRVAPEAEVRVLDARLESTSVLSALKEVDVLFGCVDNDGARLVLNEVSRAYDIPLLDLGVGIEAAGGRVSSIGGRVVIVHPGGPCLACMNEIDQTEARYFLASDEERADEMGLGYVEGIDDVAPSVVSLNSAIAACAVNEFAILVSGVRPHHAYMELDLLGTAQAVKSQWLTPRTVQRREGCVQCGFSSLGDRVEVERYAVHNR